MRRWLHVAARSAAAALAAAGFVVGSGTASSGRAPAVGPGDWPAYLGGPAHTSRSSDSAITPANASRLEQRWHFDIPYVSSPVVAGGSVFLGSFAVTEDILGHKRPPRGCLQYGQVQLSASGGTCPSGISPTVQSEIPDGTKYPTNSGRNVVA